MFSLRERRAGCRGGFQVWALNMEVELDRVTSGLREDGAELGKGLESSLSE